MPLFYLLTRGGLSYAGPQAARHDERCNQRLRESSPTHTSLPVPQPRKPHKPLHKRRRAPRSQSPALFHEKYVGQSVSDPTMSIGPPSGVKVRTSVAREQDELCDQARLVRKE